MRGGDPNDKKLVGGAWKGEMMDDGLDGEFEAVAAMASAEIRNWELTRDWFASQIYLVDWKILKLLRLDLPTRCAIA